MMIITTFGIKKKGLKILQKCSQYEVGNNNFNNNQPLSNTGMNFNNNQRGYNQGFQQDNIGSPY